MPLSTDIASIKNRMGWQLGLQTATLLSIGNLNSSVRDQTEIIGSKIDDFKQDTIDKLEDVESSINSLEVSMIRGIEEIKWVLGSIDTKLSRLIGLIEFSNATESTEKFKIGFELYKQGFYEKSLKSFENSIDSNPLNLNAIMGVYLCKKEKDIYDKKLLNDIIKLTKADFLYHLDNSDDYKETSVNYFVNFCLGELLAQKMHEEVIRIYELEIPEHSKRNESIRLKYATSLVCLGKEYKTIFNEFLSEGNLDKLLMFLYYEEDNVHVLKFLKEFVDLITQRLPEVKNLNNVDYSAQQKALLLKSSLLENKKFIIDFACLNRSFSTKTKDLKLFFDVIADFGERMNQMNLDLSTKRDLARIIENLKEPLFFESNNKYLESGFSIIKSDFLETFQKYRADKANQFSKDVKFIENIINDANSKYPKFPEDSEETYKIVNRFLKGIDLKNNKIILSKIF